MSEPYNVGDSITVEQVGLGAPVLQIRTVARVTKTKVVDSAGREWNARNGREWGCGRDPWFRGPRIRPTEPRDADAIRLGKARIRARNLADGLSVKIRDCQNAEWLEALSNAISALSEPAT